MSAVLVAAFVALHDDRCPPGPEEVERMRRALGGDPSVRTLRRGALALAWAGDEYDGDDRGPVVHVDGALYDVDGSLPGDAHSLADSLVDGDAILPRLRGDFVVLRFDPVTGQGIAVRDQLGGRGLVWHHTGSRLVLASDVRELLGVLPGRPPPDEAALAHWLALSGQPGDRTLYDGVRRVPGGSLLRFGAGYPRVERYWQPRYRRPEPRSVEHSAAELRPLLGRAVRRRLAGEETTGVMLSGGLDSGAVAALAADANGTPTPVRAYSATFPGHATLDESALIGMMRDTCGMAGGEVVVTGGSAIAGAVEYLEHWALPPQSPNLFFWFPLLRRAAADGVDVLLGGEGGDELFGLSPYLVADHLAGGHVRAAVQAVRDMPGGGPHLGRAAIRPFLREYGVKGLLPGRVHDAYRRLRGPARYTPEWLRPAMGRAFLATDETATWKRGGAPRWWAFLVESAVQGMAPALTYDHVRRRAAQAGMAARHPLVDVDVVEYVLGLPPALAYDTRYSRPLLRAALAGLVPDAVRLRPTKSFFDPVFHESLAGRDLPAARALLDPSRALVGAYADLDTVERRLLAVVPAPPDRQRWALELWRLVTAECWLRQQSGQRLATLVELRETRVPAELSLVAVGS